MYYNKQGKKISIIEWEKLMGKKNYKIIQQDTLPNGKFISTIWLGLDHQLGAGEPLIFETMVFPEKGDFMDEDMERYSTLKDAKNGHKEMMQKYQED